MKNLEYPDVAAVRKYILCCAVKLGVFVEHQGFDTERFVKQFKLALDKIEATAIVEKCFQKIKENVSDDVLAYRGYMCLMSSKVGDGIRNLLRNLQKSKNILS